MPDVFKVIALERLSVRARRKLSKADVIRADAGLEEIHKELGI